MLPFFNRFLFFIVCSAKRKKRGKKNKEMSEALHWFIDGFCFQIKPAQVCSTHWINRFGHGFVRVNNTNLFPFLSCFSTKWTVHVVSHVKNPFNCNKLFRQLKLPKIMKIFYVSYQQLLEGTHWWMAWIVVKLCDRNLVLSLFHSSIFSFFGNHCFS